MFAPIWSYILSSARDAVTQSVHRIRPSSRPPALSISSNEPFQPATLPSRLPVNGGFIRMAIVLSAPVKKLAPGPRDRFGLLRLVVCLSVIGWPVWRSTYSRAASSDVAHEDRFSESVRPVLEQYCFGCHGMGSKKGGVSLDGFADGPSAAASPELWHSVLKNVRAGIMPPPGKPRPSAADLETIENWIKRDAFRGDPSNPDPGRVTLRRLNRVEYRNTVRDLMGIDFRTDEEFPADDSGYGFDNIGDVLTVSPLLLEKYVQAAESIVARAVPTVSRAVPVRVFTGADFRGDKEVRAERMTFYKEAKVVPDLQGPARWHLPLERRARGRRQLRPRAWQVPASASRPTLAS